MVNKGFRGPQKQGDLARTAEVLFESRGIVEIKQFEDKTRRDIEDKKTQLKQLVGDSHSDVIGCTNQILAMATRSDDVIRSLGTMQDRLSSLIVVSSSGRSSNKDAGHSSPRTPKAERSDKRASLFAVGARVKYLLDTTEAIWGHLDAAELLQASARFTRACLIHAELSNPKEISPTLSGTFPLVRSQWAQVYKLQGEIEARCTAALKPLQAQHVITAASAAEAVAALAVLKSSLTHADALELVLAAAGERTLTALQPNEFATAAAAAAASADESPAAAAARQLAAAAKLVQDGVALVGSVFGGRLASVFAPTSSSDGFDPRIWEDLPPLPGRPHLTASEVDAWTALLDGVALRLAAGASADALRSRCLEWLAAIAAEFQRRAGSVLREACRDPRDLATLEATCRAELAAWDVTRVLPTSADDVGTAATSAASWPATCQAVLGRVMDPWAELLENPFVARAQSLLDALCGQTGAAVKEALQTQLETAATAAEGAVLGQLGEGVRSALSLVCDLAQIRDRGASSQPSAGPTPRGPSSFLRPQASVAAADDAGPRPALALEDRARKLAPHLQASVVSLAKDLGAALEFRLGELQKTGRGAESAAASHRAIVLGRVALALAGPGSLLPTALGPHDKWPRVIADPDSVTTAPDEPRRGGGAQRPPLSAPSSAPAPSSEALVEVQGHFQAVSSQSFGLWATWHARGLSRELARGLRGDPTLVSREAPAHWPKLQVAGNDASAAVEFALPASPSPALTWVLMAAAKELQVQLGNCSSRFLPPSQLLGVYQQYIWEVQAALLATYSEEGVEGALARVVTDSGSLQLLFDVRFLREALSGGLPPSAEPPLLLARRQQGLQLEDALAARLDPIDWATYEPHLFALVAQALQRTSLLVGLLMQCSRTVMSRPEMSKLSPPFEANTIALAPVAHRFAYLPVAMPGGSMALQAGAAARNKEGGLWGSKTTNEASTSEFCGAGSHSDLFTPVSGRVGWRSVRGGGLAPTDSTNSISGLVVSGSVSSADYDSSAYGLMSSLRGKVGEIAGLTQQKLSLGLPMELPSGLMAGAGSFLGLSNPWGTGQ